MLVAREEKSLCKGQSFCIQNTMLKRGWSLYNMITSRAIRSNEIMDNSHKGYVLSMFTLLRVRI
jgi:hypothetical protein